MDLPLIVGVDGSQSSLQAVDWAVDEATLHGLPLRLLYASLWERYEGVSYTDNLGLPAQDDSGQGIVGAAAERAARRNPEVEVSTSVLPEETEPALLREARNATALITGSRGRGPLAELLLGSVSLAMAARAHCPVVVVRGGETSRAGRHGRVLLGVADPGPDLASVRFAFREAEARHCPLEAVSAWRCPAQDARAHPVPTAEFAAEHEARASALLDAALKSAAADHPDVPVTRTIIEGPAHKVLRDLSVTADLLVLGAHRRHSHLGLQLGRVAHALLHHADCPVAIVPQRG
ncbi:universal stress protein [Streptomyces violascens]|uniref:universal stress protein n=1 Tax=Streptomyces violascens TaxID=67381 RepID=UPI003698935D